MRELRIVVRASLAFALGMAVAWVPATALGDGRVAEGCTYVAPQDAIECVAVSAPVNDRIRLSVVRADAERVGATRARERAHAFVDEILAEARVSLRAATETHAEIDAALRFAVVAVLLDGGMVVRATIPVEPLRAKAPGAVLPGGARP